MGYRILNFSIYVLLLLSDFIGFFYTRFSYKQRWISFLGELMQLLYESNECCFSFRFFFLQFLLPCLINACLSVCVCVFPQFSLFPLSIKWWPLWFVFSLELIAQTIRTHTHTHKQKMDISLSVLVCVYREYGIFHLYIGSSIRVWVTAKLLIVFFLFFVRFCVYVWFRFAFVCVYLPWRVICMAINGFHTQQFGFFRNQENK